MVTLLAIFLCRRAQLLPFTYSTGIHLQMFRLLMPHALAVPKCSGQSGLLSIHFDPPFVKHCHNQWLIWGGGAFGHGPIWLNVFDFPRFFPLRRYMVACLTRRTPLWSPLWPPYLASSLASPLASLYLKRHTQFLFKHESIDSDNGLK